MMPLKFGNRASGQRLGDRDHRGQRRRHPHRRAVAAPARPTPAVSEISTEFSVVTAGTSSSSAIIAGSTPPEPSVDRLPGDHQVEPGALHRRREHLRGQPEIRADQRLVGDLHRRRRTHREALAHGRGGGLAGAIDSTTTSASGILVGVATAPTSSARSPISSSTVSLAPRSARPVSRLELAIPVRVRDLLDQDDDLHSPLLRLIESIRPARDAASRRGRTGYRGQRRREVDDAETRPLPVDPIAEAKRQWIAHGWTDAAAGMSAVTSIIRAQQLMLARIDATLQAVRLSFARYEMLRCSASPARDGCRWPARIARLQVHPTSVTNTVDRLDADGLVEREPHPDDGRPRCSCLTDAGRELVERATARAQRRGVRRAGLSDDDTDELVSIIARFRQGRRRLRRSRAGPRPARSDRETVARRASHALTGSAVGTVAVGRASRGRRPCPPSGRRCRTAPAKTCRSNRRPSASEVSSAASSAAFAAYTDGQRLRGDRVGDLRGLVQQVGGGDDPRDEPGALGLRGIHHPAGEHELGGLVVADRADEALRCRPCRG